MVRSWVESQQLDVYSKKVTGLGVQEILRAFISEKLFCIKDDVVLEPSNTHLKEVCTGPPMDRN